MDKLKVYPETRGLVLGGSPPRHLSSPPQILLAPRRTSDGKKKTHLGQKMQERTMTFPLGGTLNLFLVLSTYKDTNKVVLSFVPRLYHLQQFVLIF